MDWGLIVRGKYDLVNTIESVLHVCDHTNKRDVHKREEIRVLLTVHGLENKVLTVLSNHHYNT